MKEKLSTEQVESIKKMLAMGMTNTAIAKQHGVVQSTVSRIKNKEIHDLREKGKVAISGIVPCLLLGYEIEKSRCDPKSHPACRECQ